MEMCYQVLIQEKRLTQRELFYKLLCDSPDYFTSQLQVNRTIQGHTLSLFLFHLRKIEMHEGCRLIYAYTLDIMYGM